MGFLFVPVHAGEALDSIPTQKKGIAMNRDGVTRLNPVVLKKAMTEKGLSAWKLHQKADLDIRTVKQALKGLEIRQSSADKILEILGLNYHDAVAPNYRMDA